MPPHPLTNYEIQKNYKNKPKFNGVYSRNDLVKIKDGAYIINLHECRSIGTHWIACMLMAIMRAHFTTQHALMTLELKNGIWFFWGFT